jgi:O-antigen ligase
LAPSIVFETATKNAAVETSFNLFNHYNSVVLLGPVALSTRLAFCFAIFFRILLNFKKIRFPALTTAWLVSIFLAVAGLVYAVILGSENSSGLTVGFRIALSMGAVLVAKSVFNKEEYYRGLYKVIFLSVLLLTAGVMGGHWFFITFGFIPYFWLVVRPRILSVIPLFFSFNILLNIGSSVTILGVLFVSILFFIFIQFKFVYSFKYILQNKFIISVLILIPILITLYTLHLNSSGVYDLSSFKGYAEFKLLGDRKPVWDATFSLIKHSFFIIPAGSSLDVYFDFLNKWKIWESGAHNIFLEIGKQIGGIGMILLSTMLLVMLYRTAKEVRSKHETVILYCFLSIYLIFGLTGNSLVYDGVGAFYWFLLGQFYCVIREPKALQPDKSIARLPDVHTIGN